MKTDEEIKGFIDSKEAITRNELNKFMYGYNKVSTRCRSAKWWEYVLQNKDWEKLRDYAESKINQVNVFGKRYQQFKKIYLTDQRLITAGRVITKRILKDIYGLDMNISVVARYLKKLRKENETILN